MFGFGIVEILIVLGLLVVVFGAKGAAEIVRKGFGTYQKVRQTKEELKSMANLDRLLGKKDKDD